MKKADGRIKHGCSRTRLYNIWKDMRKRCNNPNHKDYDNYGGKGIVVTYVWSDFIRFQEWSIENGYTNELTIDRIDSDSDYTPINCRWATLTVQARNKGIYKNNKSGYKGVCWKKQNKRWVARIGLDGKKIQLGYFDTALEGAIAYDKFVINNHLEHKLNGVLDGHKKA